MAWTVHNSDPGDEGDEDVPRDPYPDEPLYVPEDWHMYQ